MLLLLPEAGFVLQQVPEPSGKVRIVQRKGAKPIPYADSAV